MTLRVAIVGCGKIADGHVEQIRATGLADVVAVCDSEILMAEQLALRFAIPAHYGDLEEMLRRESVDVLHIATPPGSHLALTRIAVANGCHVFVEKPVAPDASQAEEIVRVAQRAGRKLAANFLYNFETPTLELMQAVEAGRLGDIVHVDVTYGYDLAGAYGVAVLSDPGHWVHSLPGKLFHNVIDHVTCKLVPLLPEGEPEVYCHSFRRRAPVGQPTVDALHDELRCELACGGVTASIMISAHARPVGHIMRVFGARDSMTLDFLGRTAITQPRQRQPGSVGRLAVGFEQARQFRRSAWGNFRQFRHAEFHFFQGMRVLLNRFYGSILHAQPDPIPAELVLRSCRMIDAIIQATGESTASTGAMA